MSSVQLKPACLSEVLDCIVPYVIQTKQYNVIVLLRIDNQIVLYHIYSAKNTLLLY